MTISDHCSACRRRLYRGTGHWLGHDKDCPRFGKQPDNEKEETDG